MYFELEILNDLVLNKLTPTTSSHNNLVLEEYLSIAHTESFKIKEKIADKILNLSDSNHFLLIQNLQRDLTSLADQLYTKIGLGDTLYEVDDDLSLKNVQRITYFIIEDLIMFLKERYGAYFDLDIKPTQNSILNAVSSLTIDICELQALSTEPNTFLDAIISQITNNITFPQTLTYRRIEFLQQLIAEIASEEKSDPESALSQVMIERIIYCNFNEPRIIKFITRYYKKTIETIDQEIDKIEKLLWFLKLTNQIPEHPCLVFLPGQKSAKEQLCIWIYEELSFYEKKLFRFSVSEKESLKKFENGYKISINSSTDDFGFFTKILFEVGAYKGVEVTELFEFYATFYHTKGTLNNSAGGMRGGYYTISQSTVTRVKAFIFKMIRYIQDHYPGTIIYTSTLLPLTGEILYMIPWSE